MITAVINGNLGKKPELKHSKAGKLMATFTVASTIRREGREPETTWVDVLCFDELADGVAGNLDKGMKVVLTGDLSLESYESKDGTPRTALRMIAREVALSVRAKREPEAASNSGRRDDPW
jgi:single-strand DNA-binding protein